MQKLTQPSHTDTAALLCHLVVYELAAFAINRRWLTAANLVESARLWFAHGGRVSVWADRIAAVHRAQHIARRLVADGKIQPATLLPGRLLFADSLTVNYADPVVGHVWRACLESVRAHA
ncbi:hypothetical protein [Paraburkholderia sp. BCC1885]|uniref:hypothetical protein n=1 Tax=Paraburkholderia sp. BCC1885 TaxID=2562669 RepID=UPI0011841DBE|nr:hypothetical protein [Paraburkholderia sp. BCC1885]